LAVVVRKEMFSSLNRQHKPKRIGLDLIIQFEHT